MGFEAIGLALKTRLQTISGLKKVYAPSEFPDSINDFPAALILPGETNYHVTLGSFHKTAFRVILLFARQDMPSATNKLLNYVEDSGEESIKEAIEGDRTLGGTAADCQVQRNMGFGSTEWGATKYLSTEFQGIVIS
jgi:hypothetical protein